MSQLEKRKTIVTKYLENPNISLNKLSKVLKCPRSTVQNVIKKYKQDLTVERKAGSGRKPGSHQPKIEKTVTSLLHRNPNLSERAVAGMVKTSRSTVHRMKGRRGLRSFKVQKVPNRDEKQNLKAKFRGRKLYDQYLTKYECCIMDDETYCVADFSQIPGKEYYVAMKRGDVEDKFKERKASKYPKKYLIWQAICSCGKKSKAFIKSGKINGEIYTEECLKKRLYPFLRSHNKSPFFWPDLATSHYCKLATDFYKEKGIVVVGRGENPPNCPELRPVEKYWAHIKRKLKASKAKAVDLKTFRRKWIAAANQINEGDVQTLMKGIKTKVRKLLRN